jgi:hypothetical protein
MMMNNQNMMVFNVELGFTALPHLPDLPARGILESPTHQATYAAITAGTFLQISIAFTHWMHAKGQSNLAIFQRPFRIRELPLAHAPTAGL